MFNPVDGSGSFDCSYADGPSTHDLSATVSDDAGGSPSNTPAVTVDNVAPAIAISGAASVDEVGTNSLTRARSPTPAPTRSRATSCTGRRQHRQLRLQRRPDPHLRRRRQRLRRHRRPRRRGRHLPRPRERPRCNNVDPTVTHGCKPGQRGLDPHLQLHDQRSRRRGLRPRRTGLRRRHALRRDLQLGTGAGSFECTYADGPSTHNPSVTVSDGDGGSDSDSTAVTVDNVDPTVTLTGASPVNEGSTHTTVNMMTDPGSPETFSRDAQSCDGGTLSGERSTRSTAAAASSAATPRPSSHNPSVTVSDGRRRLGQRTRSR